MGLLVRSFLVRLPNSQRVGEPDQVIPHCKFQWTVGFFCQVSQRRTRNLRNLKRILTVKQWGSLLGHLPLKLSVKCWFLLPFKSKDVPEIWGIQGCTSLDSTTVEVLSLRSLLTIVPFCWASQPKLLPKSKECLYGLTSTLPLAQRERALLILYIYIEINNGHTAMKRL